MALSIDRVVDLSRGAIEEDGEAQELAMVVLSMLTRSPRAIGYRWRWRGNVLGVPHEWQFSPTPISHPDVECCLLYDASDVKEFFRIASECIEGEFDSSFSF